MEIPVWVWPIGLLIAYLMYSKETHPCERKDHPQMWKYDWEYTYNWSTTFVMDCSKNAHKVKDPLLFDGEVGMEDLSFSLKFKGEATTCHTTAYAYVNYFCGESFASPYAQEYAIVLPPELFALFVSSRPEEIQSIWRGGVGQMDSDGKSHVYVLQTRPDNNYHMYQSFIEEYTLRTYLDKTKDHNILTPEDMLDFLEDMSVLDRATEWTTEMSEVYEKHFHVYLSDYGRMNTLTADTELAIQISLECFLDEDSRELFADFFGLEAESLPLAERAQQK